MGEIVRHVKHNENYQKGESEIIIEKGDLSPGIYIYKLDAIGKKSSYSASRNMCIR